MNKNIIITLLLAIFSMLACAQSMEVNLQNIDFYHNNSDVIITYDIANYSSNELYTITVKVNRENGSLLNVISLEGDLINVLGGSGKKIIWKAKNDGYVLDEKIRITLSITTKVSIPLAKHLGKSIIYPGWGDSKIRNGKGYFLIGVAAYGAIGASVYMNHLSYKNYENYKTTFDIDESNKLFNKASQQQNLSYLFAATATAIWTVDLALITTKSSKLKKQITKENSEYYYDKTQQTNSLTSNSTYINTKQPYDLAIERGNKLFNQEKYDEAKIAFEEAKSFENTDLVQTKIESTTKIIAELKNQQAEYQNELKNAQVLTDKKLYLEAKASYEKALSIKPKEKYPKEKINELNLILTQLENQKIFEAELELGNINLNNKNYETAKTHFEAALNYKPDDPIAISKLNRCNDAIAITEQKRIDFEYKQKISQGNIAYTQKKYLQAKDLYNEALELKPDQTEALLKIESCENAIAKIEEAKNNAEYKRLIILADNAFNSRQFDKAKELYTQAQQILPAETYPSIKIASINKKMEAGGDETDMNAIYEKCKSGVFYVMELGVNYWDEVKVKSQGSGFFVSSNGIGISNHHVLNNSNYENSVIVLDKDNIFEIEKIIEQNEELDYVIFKVKLNGKKITSLKTSAIEPKITNKVFAIGNPEGLDRRYTPGTVNGFENNKDLIAIDVSITHGSSGGPLFNMKGEVIGITSGGHGFEGGNFNVAVNIQRLKLYRFL